MAPFTAAMNRDLRAALDHVRRASLTLDTVEQEDVRLPAFARTVDDVRRRLDRGSGVVVLTGIDLDPFSDAETAIVAWALANYLGRPIRQGLHKDRRIFSVTDTGVANKDPIRIGNSGRESAMHTDNGCLEPRPPNYIGLLCVHAAEDGGKSRVISAATAHNAMLERHPDLVTALYEPYHFVPPQLHTWPNGPATIVKPIFERIDGEMAIHYARVMVEPGMAKAGKPLSNRQRAALDALDGVLADDSLAFTHRLGRGEMLVIDNVATVHGRTAFVDGTTPDAKRLLQRVWMWRRHGPVGDDPVRLDALELG
ncbi:MAG: TauD/TfdA family dioxygenase [Gammaproteobacteria bacterium]|nr:TauD/TfdA family dioxygenase [Gammaproteobacteria bacterium]